MTYFIKVSDGQTAAQIRFVFRPWLPQATEPWTAITPGLLGADRGIWLAGWLFRPGGEFLFEGVPRGGSTRTGVLTLDADGEVRALRVGSGGKGVHLLHARAVLQQKVQWEVTAIA